MSERINPRNIDNDELTRDWPDSFKKTRQRIDIYRVLKFAGQPLSAYDIYDELVKSGITSYAISTVYRCLLAFEKSGIIAKIVISSEDQALYDIKSFSHKHYAICLKCHKKIPLKACPLPDLHDLSDGEPEGFSITGHQLEIYGYCMECKKSLG